MVLQGTEWGVIGSFTGKHRVMWKLSLSHGSYIKKKGLHSGHVTRDNNKSVYLSISFVFAAVAENTAET